MAFYDYLIFDGVKLPLPDSYDVEFSDIEADSSGETEAGTIQRDIVRSGVVTISVSFSVSPKWLATLSAFSKQAVINVGYFDSEALDIRYTDMYITGFKVKLEKDTSYKGLWSVSFTLNEY